MTKTCPDCHAEVLSTSHRMGTTPEIATVRRYVKAARGAIESGQVVDKDVHGTLTKVIEMLDAIAATPALNLETIEKLLALLNPLHGDLDKQTYDEKVSLCFDAPRDHEYAVTVTAQHERDLNQAVCILESRLRNV
jgi:hypothetical protein